MTPQPEFWRVNSQWWIWNDEEQEDEFISGQSTPFATREEAVAHALSRIEHEEWVQVVHYPVQA